MARSSRLSACRSNESTALGGSLTGGAALTASAGTFTPAEATLTYTWLRDGVPIADAAPIATRISTPEDVGHVTSVRIDLVQTGYAGASQTLTPGSLVQTQAFIVARARPRHGNLRVDVTVSAPGLAVPVAGQVVIKLQGHPPRTIVLTNGAAMARFVNLGRGDHQVKVSYADADLVRGSRLTLTVHVKN